MSLTGWQLAWLKSHRDPWLFATGVMGYLPAGAPNPNNDRQLEGWQDKFLREFFKGPDGAETDEPRHSVRSGHGVGKSTVIAILALWFPLTHYDSKTVITANSQDQLRINNWAELKKQAALLPEALRAQIQIDEETAYVKAAPEMGFVVRRTASKHNPEALAGIHATHVLYLIDEASGIEDIVFETAAGSLSTKGAMAAMFSNPTRSSGFFFDSHNKMRARWRCWHVSSEDVPRAQGHIIDIITAYGKNSNKYKVRVEGNFPTADDETVIPLDLVMSARGRDVLPSNVWPIWGLDVARFGDDTTALCMRQGNTILGLKEWHGLDGAQVAGRIQSLYRATPLHERPREVVVDVIGVGASVYDILRLPGSECAHTVRGCNVAETPSISDEDHRLRDELWFRGRAWFADRKCHIPREFFDPNDSKLIEKLIAELTAPTYDFTHLGKRVVESKADLKKRGVASPNIADAFLLSLAGGIYPRDNPHQRTISTDSGSWMSA